MPAAIDAFKKALAIDDNYAKAWSNLGSALGEQKNFSAAVAAFKKRWPSMTNRLRPGPTSAVPWENRRTFHDGHVISVSFSRDSKYLLTGSKDKIARLWNLQTGKVVARLNHDAQVQAVGFSPDPKNPTFFTKSENAIRLWRIDMGKKK